MTDKTSKSAITRLRSRFALAVIIVTLILVLPVSILAAISYVAPDSPYNILKPDTRAPRNETGLAIGIVLNVEPEIRSIMAYEHTSGMNSGHNVESFYGSVIDLNGAQDITYINITIYNPYLNPMTTIVWSKAENMLPESNPGIILEGVGGLSPDNYYADNGRIICWRPGIDRDDINRNIRDGIIEFQAVYTYGKGTIPGTYYIDLTVADETGTVGQYIIDDTTFINGETEIEMKKGWNLFSLPLYPLNDIYADDLLSRIPYSKKVTCWDGVGQRYISHLKSVPIYNFEIFYGVGYFIKVEADISITFHGTELDERDSTVEVGNNILLAHITYPPCLDELQKGWNLFGLPYHEHEKEASQLLARVANSQSIAKWNADTQSFTSAIKKVMENDFTVGPGEGYFILTTDKSRLGLGNIRAIDPEMLHI